MKSLIDQALELPAQERAIVAEQLLLSLDSPTSEIDELWIKESEARLDAYERGKIAATSIQEVFRKYD